jgi:dCMP deaminase
MKARMEDFYMDIADRCARQSRAQRLQVGAVIVKNDNIISFGWNGTPSGWDNECEVKEYMPGNAGGWLDPEEIEEQWPYREQQHPKESNVWMRYNLKTKPEVLHAEMNALMKLTKSTETGQGATLFITHAPCIHCAKATYQAGITEVIFKNVYRSHEGMDFLKNAGINIKKK